MGHIAGFKSADEVSLTPPTAVTPPAVEAPVVEPPTAVAPVVETAPVVEPAATEETKDEVEAPKVEEKDDDSSSDEKYVEFEGIKYIKAEDVKDIVKKRVGRIQQDKIQQAAADLSKDILNAKSLLENDNKALKRENEVLKLSKGNERTFELLDLTGLSGDNLKAYAEKLATATPVVTNSAEKEFREKVTEKPSTPFNIAAVMSAAREGRK
jgi:hypothetical protein